MSVHSGMDVEQIEVSTHDDVVNDEVINDEVINDDVEDVHDDVERANATLTPIRPLRGVRVNMGILRKLKMIALNIGFGCIVIVELIILLSAPILMAAFDFPRYWNDSPPPTGIQYLLFFNLAFSLSWLVLLFKPNGMLHDAIEEALGLLTIQGAVTAGFIGVSHIIGALILQKGRIHTFTLTTFWLGAIIVSFMICTVISIVKIKWHNC